MNLLWLPDADLAMKRLEGDRSRSRVHAAVLRTLARLERDPFQPRLLNRQFATEMYGQLRCTPTMLGDWSILWTAGPEPDEITIVYIAETVL